MKKLLLTISLVVGMAGVSLAGTPTPPTLPTASPYNKVLGSKLTTNGFFNPSSIALTGPMLRHTPAMAPAKIALNANVYAEALSTTGDWGNYYTLHLLQPSLTLSAAIGDENMHYDPTYGVYSYDGKFMIRSKGGGGSFVLNNAFEFAQQPDGSFAETGAFLTKFNDYSGLAWSATASNPADQCAYGTFFSEDGSKGVWGCYDPVNNEQKFRTDNEVSYYALAFTKEGKLYAITFDGEFGTVDPQTGNFTKISSLGLTPSEYRTGAYYDLALDKVFTHIIVKNGDSAEVHVCLIDPNDGSLNDLGILPEPVQYMGWHSMPLAKDGAPAVAENLLADFNPGSLAGSVSFSLPTKTYGGATLDASASLAYKVFVGAEEIASGSALPGASASCTYTAPASGNYTFTVRTSNGDGNSPDATTTLWIGDATPVGVTNAQAWRVDANNVKVEWAAVAGVVEGAEIDPADITYTVTCSDGRTVATDIAETSVVDPVTYTGNATFSYNIVAKYGDNSSAATATNPVSFGLIQVPYLNAFHNSYEAESDFVAEDGNGDGATWEWNRTLNAPTLLPPFSDSQYQSHDDWFISQPIAMKAGKIYRITVNAFTIDYQTEHHLQLHIGTKPNIGGMTSEISSPFVMGYRYINEGDQAPEGTDCSVEYTPEADGNYCLGIEVTAQGVVPTFYDVIRRVEITEIAATSPAAVADLKVIPGDKGALSATVAFTAPATTIAGQPLDAISRIEVLRDGKLAYTIPAPQPGAQCSYLDENYTESQYGNYSVVAYDANGNEGRLAADSKWIGLDIPANVNDLKMTPKGENNEQVEITWTAPTIGAHGGYIDPSKLTYGVGRVDLEWGTVYDVNELTGFSITLTPDIAQRQDMVYYAVSALNDEGQGGWIMTNPVVKGEPYEMPMRESLAGLAPSVLPWMLIDNNGDGRWAPGIGSQYPYFDAVDGDEGLFLFYPTEEGSEELVVSPYVDVTGAENPVLAFWVYYDPQYPVDYDLEVIAMKDYFTRQSLTTIHTLDGTPKGWKRHVIELKNLPEKKTMIAFRAVANKPNAILGLDKIEVFNLLDHDIEVSDIQADNYQVSVGGKATITAQVRNIGKNDEANVPVYLVSDGALSQSVTLDKLASDQATKVKFRIAPDATAPDYGHYSIKAACAADMNPVNDETKTIRIRQPRLHLPVPQNLTAVPSDGAVKLEWTPVPESYMECATVDDFEQYEAYAMDNAGDWTFVNVDGKPSLSIEGVTYPGAGESCAAQIFNDQISGQYASAYKAASGHQTLTFFNSTEPPTDRWAISPELYGMEQLVSFLVKTSYYNGTNYTEENFEIYYSTTTPDIAAMTKIGNTMTATADWNRLSVILPAGAKYFAIRCVTNYFGHALLIDDFSYECAEADGVRTPLTLVGYNLFCNDVKLNAEPLNALSFVDVPTTQSRRDYTVSAVYSIGESSRSNSASVQLSPIDTVEADSMTARSGESCIIFDAPADALVEVVATNGIVLYRGVNPGILLTAPGVYVVNFPGHSASSISVK